MKKVLYVFRQYASPPEGIGGTRHYDFSKELKKYNIETYIFVSSFNHMTKKESREIHGKYLLENINGVNFVWVKSFSYSVNDWRRFFNILTYGWNSYFAARNIAKKENKPHFSMGSIAHVFSLASAYLISKKTKSKYIIDVGDLWPEVFANNNTISKNGMVFYFLKKYTFFFYQRASLIMCLTNSSYQYFVENKLGKRATIIPPSTVVSAKKCGSQHSCPTNYFNIFYIGSFQKIYNLEAVINAATLLKENSSIRFIMIGEGESKNKLENMVYKRNLSNVLLRPAIPKSKVYEVLKDASACLFIESGADFGFPNKLLDYTKAAKPIIYASPTQHEILSYDACVEAHYDNSTDIAKMAVKLSLLNKKDLNNLGNNSYRYFTDNHDISKNCMVLYNRLIKC